MEKRVKREKTLYVYILKKNHDWIEEQMKELGYSRQRGKSEFIDNILTGLRHKKNPEEALLEKAIRKAALSSV